MATISDTLTRADGTAVAHQVIAFLPRASTAALTGVVCMAPLTVKTGASGTFTISLRPGNYIVRWRRGDDNALSEELEITVPDNSNTYSLSEL